MTSLPIAQTHHPAGATRSANATVTLDYEARFLRRKRLTTDDGWSFVVDLVQTTSLDHGDLLELDDGRWVEIRAAAEPVLDVTGDNLARLAWHIGNRHTPCQIYEDRLRIRKDKVIAHMLEHLGAILTEAEAPFTPEGGAYGFGRTHSHEHGASAHEH
ncbi:urease accessory protein UreE [Sulfitobacter sp. JB4-11]|uniref:urease accessory protein UreE n=1 Tax=Sulfitobacter rhodophyticola TaxID=3238304 RepID=UPI003517A486